MDITIEKITPALAAQYLNANLSNRKLRPGVVEKYASDMASGRWTDCAMPIVFYDDGDVADGQHRLWGIVESGTTQTFHVRRNFPRQAGLNIDTGFGRTLVDNATISGSDQGVSHTLLAVSRAVALGARSQGTLSNSQKLDILAEHREASAWAATNGPKSKGIRNAMVLGALARAWYHERDTDKLRRYCDVLDNGFADGSAESAAVAMRNYLLAKGSAASGPAMWRDSFLKVQNSISYFMRGKSLTVIKGISDEVYPLRRTPKK